MQRQSPVARSSHDSTRRVSPSRVRGSNPNTQKPFRRQARQLSAYGFPGNPAFKSRSEKLPGTIVQLGRQSIAPAACGTVVTINPLPRHACHFTATPDVKTKSTVTRDEPNRSVAGEISSELRNSKKSMGNKPYDPRTLCLLCQ